jgi:hypothetical protein
VHLGHMPWALKKRKKDEEEEVSLEFHKKNGYFT